MNHDPTTPSWPSGRTACPGRHARAFRRGRWTSTRTASEAVVGQRLDARALVAAVVAGRGPADRAGGRHTRRAAAHRTRRTCVGPSERRHRAAARGTRCAARLAHGYRPRSPGPVRGAVHHPRPAGLRGRLADLPPGPGARRAAPERRDPGRRGHATRPTATARPTGAARGRAARVEGDKAIVSIANT